jgi:MFS family permease
VNTQTAEEKTTSTLSRAQRFWILVAVFLGWMFAGMEMSLMIPATRPAIQAFVYVQGGGEKADVVQMEVLADQWLSRFIAAFLLGAAAGGALFGWLGDRAGRVKAMATSILCYSAITGVGYFANTPDQLLVLRFFACLGIGGMWPTGVALVAEALPRVSRPMSAGLIGTAANVGFLILGLLMLYHPIKPESWRWLLLLGAAPVILGCAVWAWLPESPQWTAQKRHPIPQHDTTPLASVFRPPLLRSTTLGIVLGTIPLLGGWASGQRLVPWAGQVAEQSGVQDLKAITQTVWACGAVLGSLLGGWVASSIGRRLSYFLMSLGSLGLSVYTFLMLNPADAGFRWAAFALGFAGTMFFGWLPYFLPELFPTRVRATGIGVSYNFGRILSAVAVLSSTVLSAWFQGDIARMGAATSLIYAAGLLLAWFIPADRESAEQE